MFSVRRRSGRIHALISATMSKHAKKKNDQKPSGAQDQISTGVSSCVELDKSGNIRVKICAKPGAKMSAITGVEEEGVGVQIGAPPVDGEANTELVKFMSKVFDVRKSCVTLDKGSRSRQKIILLTDTKLTVDQVLEKIKNNTE
ncbi:chromosome 15 open reading frame 40 [Nesidiocoris tenuis]|nr:chromosome 15 open reading frame 40 [Nesidiocoris tenuis]